MSQQAQSLSAKYGIPAAIPITNGKRYSYCDAHEAILASVEGKFAIYKGVCACQHEYMEKLTLEEARQRQELKIVGGEISVGGGHGYQAENLEEY